jgi:3'-5' exoribonuclease
MLRAARAILPAYPWLNQDLVYAGVILHDLCKIEELDSDSLGVVRDYTENGLLLGHLVLGVARIQQAADALGIAGEPVSLLQHMMLSHHGEEAYGSPKKPMFPEAELLHWLDLLDARMNEMQTVLSKIKPGVFSEKIWSLERRLYQPRYEELAEE